jgi:hypothetical protein
MGCGIYIVGVIIQDASHGAGGSNALGVIVAGRLIAGIGVGFESCHCHPLHESEIVSFFAPKDVRSNVADCS